jgi:presenilin-like A22 family membrane protease
MKKYRVDLLYISALPFFNLLSVGSFELIKNFGFFPVDIESMISYVCLHITILAYIIFSFLIIKKSKKLLRLKIAAIILNGALIAIFMFVLFVLSVLRSHWV